MCVPDEDPPGLHRGKDGWLFLTGGSNGVTALFDRRGDCGDAVIAAWGRLVERRMRKASRLGARFLQIVVPDKLTVYPDKLERPLVDPAQSPATRLAACVGRGSAARAYVDLIEPLRAAGRTRDVYWRTDTHWTFEGCLAAYEVLCAAVSAERAAHLPDSPYDEALIAMDLGSKFDPPITERYRAYRPLKFSTRVFANALVNLKETTGRDNEFRLHRGSHVIFRNERPDVDRRKLVIFGDSFFEYRPYSMTGLLAETFREVHFIWSNSIDWGYVRKHRPDLLFQEVAERFLRLVPKDQLDLETFVADRLARLAANEPFPIESEGRRPRSLSRVLRRRLSRLLTVSFSSTRR